MTTKKFTLSEARKAGWSVERGNYHGTTDDRIDRWYCQKTGEMTCHLKGFETRQEALDWLENYLDDCQ